MIIIKIAIFSIIAVMFGVYFRTVKPEYSLYIGAVCGIFLCGMLLNYLGQAFSQLQELESYFKEDNGVLNILLKMVGITYICELAGSLCRDAGFHAVGGQIEVFGKVCILISGIPVVQALLESIHAF